MKKRILALALCLVMATSLLPVTACGENPEYGLSITGSGFEMNAGGNYVLQNNQSEAYLHGSTYWIISELSLGLYLDAATSFPVTNGLVDGETYYFKYQIHSGDPEGLFELSIKLNDSNCSLAIPGYTASFVSCGDYDEDLYHAEVNIVFKVTKNQHEHQWQFKAARNNLTGRCGSCNKEVSVTLTAEPVTLPNSPFGAAQLDGWYDFTKAVPSAYYDPNSFDYKCNGKTVYEDNPNPKAGNYQAGVRIYGLPGFVESDEIAASAMRSNTGYSAYLYTQYTVSDPAITAQTGDNRPIELMMGSIVVFSALAAAAFALDSKRRSHH